MNTSEEKKMGAYEIAQDITAEQMSAVFFDSHALREPNYRLCQLNARGQRYYYVMNEDGTELYPSVTTILKKGSLRSLHNGEGKVRYLCTRTATRADDYAQV